MNKFFTKILILAITLSFVSAPKAEAIKIGLQSGLSDVSLATSTKGIVSDKRTGQILCSLQPMQSYRFTKKNDYIEVTIEKKKYPLNTRAITISTVTDGFVCAKNKWYRGKLIVENRNKTLNVINDVKLEDYLLGVVPCEMPYSWPSEALKAQAIAARSYAVANLGKHASQGYDLKDNTEDQAYGGASSETEKTNNIVAQTYGIVVTQNKQVITAFYCASAGGKTTNTGDVWSKDLPYLHSVPSFDGNVGKMGHGIGMSQHGANNLAKQGYNAYQILKYYYKDVKFGKLSEKWNSI